jgi:predicted Zn-dependent protease
MLDHATVLDPCFSNAWARLSLACCQMEALFEPYAHWYERSERALESGLALDPSNAEAKLARGRLLWMPRTGFHNREALRALREALRAQPGLHDAHFWDALILAHVGLLEEAERKLVELIGPHPTNAGEVQVLGQVLQLQGRFEEAVERQRQALALDAGGHYAQIMHAPVLLYADDLAGAEAALLVGRRLMGDDPLFDASEALLWAKRGEPERAEAAITSSERPRASLSHTHHSLHYVAAACALLGREDDAVAKLRTAASTGLPNYPAFARDPHFETIRERPPMAALLAELERDFQSYREEFGGAFA